MKEMNPNLLLGIGLLLMLIGFGLPTLMIMRYLESTFLLNFIAYSASFIGLVMGMLGVVMVTKRRRF
jgi:hypothetical protein